MRVTLLTIISVFTLISGFAQTKILVFHETNEFRHSSINAGISMFEDLGNENNDWVTDNSQDSSVFNDTNLAQYAAVVFLNTSGADESGSDGDLLTASEKLALENFIASGKGYIGVHAATDTYRDGSWPFYNELVGGIVQTNPNHTSNNYNADIELITSHPTVDFLGPVGSIWNKDEEYYYWEQNGGQLSNDNTVLLEVEQTGSESYDAARPITWLKESITYDDDNDTNTADVTLNNIKSFYTALGHNSSDYNSNADFRTLLKNATLWATGLSLSINDVQLNTVNLFPNPSEDFVFIPVTNSEGSTKIEVFNELGQRILRKELNADIALQNNSYKLNIEEFKSGIYIISLSTNGRNEKFKLIKN